MGDFLLLLGGRVAFDVHDRAMFCVQKRPAWGCSWMSILRHYFEISKPACQLALFATSDIILNLDTGLTQE